MSINFEQITKLYNGVPVVNDVSLQIETGEFFVLLGPSGSGKSTLLRAAAGLADIDRGRIAFHGRDVTHVPARERGVGLVFQHYALFRHMTVGENVEFALRVRGLKRSDRARRRDELLQLVALEGYAGRMPGQLSGGQQQRVAVARALAHEPAVLLLDEPFGALDAKIRVELRATIRQVQRRLGMTTILVTHDQEEAFALADRIGVMHNGRLLETGRAEALYRRPASRFVATFLGAANLFLAERSASGLRLGDAVVGQSAAAEGDDGEAVMVVRPEDIELAESAEKMRGLPFASGQVQTLEFSGAQERVRVHVPASSTVQSAIGRDTGVKSEGLSVEVTRTNAEQGQVPLVAGRRVWLGVRRFHLLPTPISSFRILESDATASAALRAAPLLRQLVQSMHAPVLSAAPEAEPERLSEGVAVLAGQAGVVPKLRQALARGARRLLVIPPLAGLPRHIAIHCLSDSARSATLSLVASVMRHLHAEAAYVGVHSAAAPRAEVTAAFRRLLDTRAEMLNTHGLDVRTDTHLGDVGSWITNLAIAPEPALVVIGLDGSAAQIDRLLSEDLAPLLAEGSRCPVLLAVGSAPTDAAQSIASARESVQG